MESKEQLIKSLSADLKATPTVNRPLSRLIVWLSVNTLGLALIMWFIQPFRPGFDEQLLNHPHFLFEVILTFATIVLFSGYVFFLSVPAIKWRFFNFSLLLLLVSPLAASLVLGLLGPSALPASMIGKRPYCHIEVFVLSWIPLLFAYRQLRISPPPNHWKPRLAMAFASVMIPVSLMHIACMYSTPHIFVFHLIPAFLTLLLGYLWGEKLSKTL